MLAIALSIYNSYFVVGNSVIPRHRSFSFFLTASQKLESVQAGLYLCSLLPSEFRNHIKWFNLEMLDRFKAQELVRLLNGDIWGLMATDSFGMVCILYLYQLTELTLQQGMDLPNIMTIVQWGATCSILTLWPRFGRCICDPELEGVAILITEKDHLDSEHMKKAENAAKKCTRMECKKQEAKRQKMIGSGIDIKREEANDLSNEEEKGKDERTLSRKPALVHKTTKKTIDAVVDDLINAVLKLYCYAL